MYRAAWLRAGAFYEHRSVGRFKASFVKQFAGQEMYSLLRRAQGEEAACLALVATLADAGGAAAAAAVPPEQGHGPVVGTLDVRLLDPSNPYAASGWPDGVPRDAGAAAAAGSAAAAGGAAAGPSAYVSNVVVAPAQRGRGLGRALLAAGLAAAEQRWPVACVYCHVEVDNEAALALYRGAGFAQLGEELPAEPDGLANRLLLCRQLLGGA